MCTFSLLQLINIHTPSDQTPVFQEHRPEANCNPPSFRCSDSHNSFHTFTNSRLLESGRDRSDELENLKRPQSIDVPCGRLALIKH